MISIDEAQRRARLGVRHGLAVPFEDVIAATDAMVALHATDPATPFLSARARVSGFGPGDLEDALYRTEVLTKHLGMRRTMFVVSDVMLPVVHAACTRKVVANERRRLAAEIEKGGVAPDGARWLIRAEKATLAALAEMGTATGAQLSRVVPEIQAKLIYAEGKAYGGPTGVATRVFTILAAEGRIRRGRPKIWTSSQHQWEIVDAPPEALTVDETVRVLVEQWLGAFGPATLADIVWWTGLGVTPVRAAVAALDTVAVDLDGESGVVLEEDVDPEPTPEPWVAFLPSLDPTTMGWKQRHWYLGDLGPLLFDRNGNAGPTIWSDGRIVGGWSQRKNGDVVYRVLEEGLDRAATRRIAAEAARLQEWLGSTVVTTRFPTPLDRELRA
jgi:hypothetical protein